MASKRVVILGNMTKEGVAPQIAALKDWFSQRAEIAGILPVDKECSSAIPPADLAVVFGGDGSILAAARMLASQQIPLLGVNMGKLGFLAEYNVEHLQKHFGDILAGRVKPVRRLMLEVCVHSGNQTRFRSPVANDVAIAAGPPFRMIELSVDQGQDHIARYLGDGLIVSTPTGSTGYNMSLGGPIMDPGLEAIVITPIAPHSLTLRPIVVTADQPVLISAVRVNNGSAVIVDGQIFSHIAQDEQVEVRRSQHSFWLVPHPGRYFFSTLSDKLQWGRSPYHQ